MRRGTTAILFAGIIFLLLLMLSLAENAERRQLLQRADLAAAQIAKPQDQAREQTGVALARISRERFSTASLWKKVAQIPSHRRHQFYVWSADNKTEFIGSASGVDLNPYFAPSYLVGYKPFETDSVWQPLATIALRKSYVLDHKLYGPNLSEVWQNSRQAYRNTRGDCEDHAIILADWLISLGYDARVALGEYRGGGHAWVVLFYEQREYILEATSKRRPKSINDFLLAGLAVDYRPVYQFDRTRFWVNSGSSYTTRYRDKKWQLRSTFLRES